MIYSFELNDEETKLVEDYMRDEGETSLPDMVKKHLLEDIVECQAADKMWKEFLEEQEAKEAEEAAKRKKIES